MGWVPSEETEQLGRRQRGYVPSPQHIKCDICQSVTFRGFYHSKDAVATGTFWPDGQRDPCRAFCPRCGLNDVRYGTAVWQSLNARHMLDLVDQIMEEYWGPVPPPAATLAVITLAHPALHGDGEDSEFQMLADDGSGGPPQLPPAGSEGPPQHPPARSLEETVVELEGRVARLEQVLREVLQREQQRSPFTSEERLAEEREVASAA